MLDFTQSNPKISAAWRDHIAAGDIVSFRFPLAEERAVGQPKARPCLVLDIEEIGGERFALVAYGTTSRRKSNVGYEVHARRREEYLSAGLDEPTRFVGRRRLLVPLAHRGFAVCKATGSPVLGALDGAPLARMHGVRGRIHAERDIATERRRRRSVRRGIDFTVETKAPCRRVARLEAGQ